MVLGVKVPWGRFWVLQSKGEVSVPTLSHRSRSTAWVVCPLLASPRASAVTCHGDTPMLLVFPFCTAIFYDSVGSCGLPHSFSKVGFEWSGLNLCDLTHLLFSWAHFFSKIEFFLPPCHFVNQFYMGVIWKCYEKRSQWRESHTTGPIYRAVLLLKHALFAQVFKLLGAGAIALHRSEWVLRWWHQILSRVLKEWSLLLKRRHSQALSSFSGHSGRCKILVFGQQQQHISEEEVWVTREKVKCKHGARMYPPGTRLVRSTKTTLLGDVYVISSMPS